MKKIFTLILSLALVVSVSLFATSCIGDGGDNPDTDDDGGYSGDGLPWLDAE